MGFSRSTTKAHAERSPLKVLKDGGGKLLLIMDEAQDFTRDFAPSPSKERSDARGLIDAIHNGKIAGRPVMLLTAGLSATKRAFKDLGVSRFKANCYIELGPLKPEAEREVIKDWLKKDARAKGDPAFWIDAIMQKTHGCPQHVAAYAESAAIHLRATGRELTPEKLQAVLGIGEMQRIKFCKSRADGIMRKERQCLAIAMVNVETDGTIDKDVIIASLREKFSAEKAEEVFALALGNGIFDLQGDRYVIPIPAMRRWFIDNYFIERDPPLDPLLIPVTCPDPRRTEDQIVRVIIPCPVDTCHLPRE